jgi:protein-S-isoprenylcysteine O-methyltransferase Ste14
MTFHSDPIAEVALGVVIACWAGFGGIFLLGKSRAATSETKSAGKFSIGFALQIVGYLICFALPRTYFSPFFPMSQTAEAALACFTILVAVVSMWFCLVAVRTLGKQWGLVARVVKGHELVITGPYAVVRNPIYLAMFGMMLATGLAVSGWQGLVAGTAVFLLGNEMRIRSEERLLREVFGAQFDDYARRVPAFFPRIL